MDDDTAKFRNIEPELLQRLGSFITKWAFIEYQVSKLFINMTGGQPGLMFAVTNSVSQSTVCDWIRTMLDCRPADPQALQEIRGALADVDELRSERNALAHGLWRSGAAGSAIINTMKLDRREVLHDRVITAADLDGLIDEELTLINKLRRILDSVVIVQWPSSGNT